MVGFDITQHVAVGPMRVDGESERRRSLVNRVYVVPVGLSS